MYYVRHYVICGTNYYEYYYKIYDLITKIICKYFDIFEYLINIQIHHNILIEYLQTRQNIVILLVVKTIGTLFSKMATFNNLWVHHE